MNTNSFLALGGMTAAVVIAAVVAVVSRSTETTPDTAGIGPLVPGLADRINQVTSLVVAGSGHTVTITRPTPDDARWTVAEKGGYPASLELVRRTILGLADAKTRERRTADPGQYAKLGVDDSGGTRLTPRTADGKELPAALIGKTAQGGDFYARRVGEAPSWLVEGKLAAPPTDAMQWLDRALPFVERDRVKSVSITRPGTPALTVARKDAKRKDFAVTGLPKDAKPKQSAVNQQASAVEFMTFEDVAKLDPAAKPDPAAVTATIRTFDGEILTIRTSPRDGKPWATISASLEPGKTGEIEQTVKDIQAKYAGWSYRLSDSLAHDLTRVADDLIDKEVKVDAAPPTTLPSSAEPVPPTPTVKPNKR